MNLRSLPKTALVCVLMLTLAGCYKTSEERAAEHFENAQQLVAEGDLPRAIVEFRNTLKYDENNLDAYRLMARANLALNQIPDAYAGFLRVVEQSPGDVEGLIALSEMAFARRNWEEFNRHSASLVEIESDQPRAKAIGIGAAYRQAASDNDTPKRDSAILQAEELAEVLPDALILQRIRIDAYVARGTYAAAIAVLDQSIANIPDDIDLYVAKLGLLGRLNDQQGIEATLRTMLDTFPDNETAKETYLRFLVSRNRLQDAEDFLEQHLTLSAAEGRNGAFFGLITFLRETKGDDAALARINATLDGPQADNQMIQMLRATLIFEMGQFEEGIAALSATLDAEPATMSDAERSNARTALARMYLINGNEARARDIVADVLALEPRLSNALKIQATLLIADDDTTGAINALRLALEGNPDDTEAMVLMANAYRRAGNQDLHQSFLARAVEASNSAPRYALLLARTLMEKDQLLQAESTLIAAIRRVPDHVEILQTLGQIYLRLDDLPRTDQVARTLDKIQMEQAQTTAQALFSELTVRRLGVDEALAFLEQQVALDGDPVGATLAIIKARLRTGRVADALRTATQAVADNPDDPRLRNALALSHASAQDFVSAKAEFTALLDAYPEAVNLYLQLARVNSAQGDLAAGAAIIEQGLTVMPNAPDLMWAQASYLEQDGKIAEAIAIYETLYSRNSESVIIANNLASLLVTYRDDVESLARAETIGRRLNGTDIPAFQDTYGYIQFRRGNLQEAQVYLERATAGLPGDPVVQFHLGEVYAALDRKPEALAQMRRALEIANPIGNPDFRDRVAAQITLLSATPLEE